MKRQINKLNTKNKTMAAESVSAQELSQITGGMRMPHIHTVTWKYLESTPSWSVNSARDMGYQVEKLG